MASPFKIEPSVQRLELDPKGQGSVIFTVTNVSGAEVRGRMRLVPEDPAEIPWVSLVDQPEHVFPVDSVLRFTVQVAVPATAPPGVYPFRLDGVDVDRPDDNFTRGPQVTFAVTESKPKPFPWLLVGGIAAGAVVLIGIIILVVVLVMGDGSKFDGDWVLNFGTMHLTHNGNSVNGTFANALDGSTGTLQGTVSNNTFNGTWSGNGSGTLSMTFNSAGSTVDGSRQGVNPPGLGRWCGAKASTAFPAGCSFAGTWRTVIDGTAFSMTLTRTMSDVVGTYSLVTTPTLGGALTGTLRYSSNTAVLTATYQVVPARTPAPRTGTSQFFLDNTNPVQFRGNWRESPTRSGAWCGGRNDSGTPVPAPSPCRFP